MRQSIWSDLASDPYKQPDSRTPGNQLGCARKSACYREVAYFAWNVFTSRGGWKIKYPEAIHISSCRSCTDVHDPDIFVSFFDRETKESMMIDPLIGKPNDRSADDWLQEISKTADLNQQLRSRWITLAGQRALQVDYRNADGTETECTYILSGRHTLEIYIDLHVRSTRLFQQMLSTFRFTSTNRSRAKSAF